MSLILLAFCGLFKITAPFHFWKPQKSAVFIPQNCPHCGQKWSARRKKAPGFLLLSRRSARNHQILPILAYSRICCKRLSQLPFLPIRAFSANAPARRRNARSLGFRWVRARLCPENRTQPRHAAHAGGQAFSCCARWNASKRFRMRSCSHSASSFASCCS